MYKSDIAKIVQAVNDSRGEPIDIGYKGYIFISRYNGRAMYEKNPVHAIDHNGDGAIWQYICTVEEFNQCVKEMSAGMNNKTDVYGKHKPFITQDVIDSATKRIVEQIKGSNMSNVSNKHPHHDLMAEWIKDTSKIIQVKKGIDEWADCNPMSVNWLFNCEYRFKPREFVKGHWYPCVDIDGEKRVYYFNGSLFCFHAEEEGLSERAESMKYMGESLGEIKFK